MDWNEAMLGVAQVLLPGLVALVFGETRRDGRPVRVIRLLWESGRP